MAEVEDEAPPPHACHGEVWALFESIWNNVCQIRWETFIHISSNLNRTKNLTEWPNARLLFVCLVTSLSSALFSVLHYSPGATEPSPRAVTPPPQEALSCLHRLSSALKQLLGALHRYTHTQNRAARPVNIPVTSPNRICSVCVLSHRST